VIAKISADMMPDRSSLNRRGSVLLMGQSAAAEKMRRMVRMTTLTDAPVMIVTGSAVAGLDIAGAIHSRSNRAMQNFRLIDCTRTQAEPNHFSALASADDGTIFIDNLARLPRSLHPFLLRLTQTGNHRIICAATRPVAYMTRECDLPPALSSAISVLTLTVPELAERKADIALLFEAYVHRMPKARRFTVSAAAANILSDHDWAGGFDELAHTVDAMGGQFAGHQASDAQVKAFLERRDLSPCPVATQ